jgi:hypothetical protein
MAEIITKDIEESPGTVSLMRKMVKQTINVGSIMILWALALATYIIVFGKDVSYIQIVVITITTGPTMIALALGAKALQANAESKTQP